MASGTASRAAALETLQKVRSGERFDSAHAAAVAGLDDADRRLAHEMAAGVLRTRTRLDRQLSSLVSGSWERTAPDLQELLRIGAYQLTRLDRVPEYAAVQATVEVAKKVAGHRAAGLVNAVLRRVAQGEGEPGPVSAGDAAGLAELHSHPQWLVDRWVSGFGLDRTRALLEHNNRKPPFVIQPVGWSQEKLRTSLAERGITAKPTPLGPGLAVEGARAEDLPGYDQGSFLVQGPAQARVLLFAEVAPGAVVWDACAAPGGKAAILSVVAQVVATELKRDRIPRLRETLQRVAPQVTVVIADAVTPPLGDQAVDVALVDAPCSATGTLARHPDGRWRLTESGIKRMAQLQLRLLDAASTVVKVGGILVYATCSLEPEENQKQVNSFLERHQNYQRERDDLFLFPPDTGTDGAFAARLRRLR